MKRWSLNARSEGQSSCSLDELIWKEGRRLVHVFSWESAKPLHGTRECEWHHFQSTTILVRRIGLKKQTILDRVRLG